jgi:hypothetical protein
MELWFGNLISNILWLSHPEKQLHIFTYIQIVTNRPPLLYSDNITALLFTDESAPYQRSKHIDTRYHYIREKFRWTMYPRKKIRRIFSKKHLVRIYIIIVFSEWASDPFILGKVSVSTLVVQIFRRQLLRMRIRQYYVVRYQQYIF